MRQGKELDTLPHNAVSQDGAFLARCSPHARSESGLTSALLFISDEKF